ncbi:MAG: putative O-glycosylation ligase, exosortase A system-associated [Sedimenticola sp.]
MRDILLTLLVNGSLQFKLRKPYLGILVWSWLSYMNPHRMTWSFAYDLPFAQIVAITLFISILINKEFRKIPVDGTVKIWIVFLLWMFVSTFFAIHFEDAAYYLERIVKIQIITFLTLMLITDKDRIDKLIWVIVISIGFFGVKGGIFTILTGGGARVWGPAQSFIEDNNTLALALLMVIPFMIYLFQINKNKWIRFGLILSTLLCCLSVLGSQSRGALIAILTVAFFFWLKSKSKVLSGGLVVLLLITGFNFMPESWHERMRTIQDYEQDASAMGRINAWQYSINIANDRITGGGLNSWSYETFAVYAPKPDDVHAAHSIYFSVLADHGWFGLIMFLLILFLTWRALSKIVESTRKRSEEEKMSEYNLLARMLQVSLIAYMSGGAFLSLSYFDLPWHLVAITILLKYQTGTYALKSMSNNKISSVKGMNNFNNSSGNS